MTVIYIDSLALLNFIINYLLLLAAAKINGVPFRRLRIGGAALFGAGYAVLVWLPGMIFLAGLFWKVLSCALMVLIAFGLRKPGRLARLALTFTAVSFLLGGAVLALGMLAGTPSPGGIPYMPVDFKTLFLASGLSYAVLTLAFRYRSRHSGRETAEVSVAWGERKIRVRALLDSGHTLIDPINGAEVLILGAEAALTVLPAHAAELISPPILRDPPAVMEVMGSLGYGTRFRLIPYQAVGTDCGFLLAFRPDSVTVRGKPRRNCLIGLSPTPLTGGVDALVSTM